MKVKKAGSFVVAGEDVKDQDLVAFKNEGEIVDGQWGEKLNVLVELPSGEEKSLSLNNTSRNTMIDEYGDDTANWVGKQAKAHIVTSNVAGKMKKVIFLTHPEKELETE